MHLSSGNFICLLSQANNSRFPFAPYLFSFAQTILSGIAASLTFKMYPESDNVSTLG